MKPMWLCLRRLFSNCLQTRRVSVEVWLDICYTYSPLLAFVVLTLEPCGNF